MFQPFSDCRRIRGAQTGLGQRLYQSRGPRKAPRNLHKAVCRAGIVRHSTAKSPAPQGCRACNSNGAGDGIRTRGYQLGKLGPYHLATPAYVFAGQTGAGDSIPCPFFPGKVHLGTCSI